MSASAKEIKVNVTGLDGIFKNKEKVIIPEYQRPYEWGKTKTAELLNDLKEFFITKRSDSPYYLGTVLFYYDAERNAYEIIDGQQRITTLLIMKRVMEKELPEAMNIDFRSHLSFRAIKETTDYARKEKALLTELTLRNFLSKLEFTQVITFAQDDSFQFFDTQNNRGVTLEATDFLKAYHLREISSEQLQDSCAVLWEKAGTKWKDGDFLNNLFYRYLYRARAWRSKNIVPENKELILSVFQAQTEEPEEKNAYPLYPNIYNRQAVKRRYADAGDFKDIPNMESTADPQFFPFNLRQPIYKGIQFFHYTQKYTSLHALLFESNIPRRHELRELNKFYNDVYNADMSVYLRDLFRLAVMIYFDVFEHQEIIKFAYHLDYLLGSIRIGQKLVKKESAQLILKKPEHNLLDMIAYAYSPKEVFDFIKSIPEKDTIYKNSKKLKDDNVQGKYRKRVYTYFEKNKSDFTNRKQWLNEK
jgi:hypothetical protein